MNSNCICTKNFVACQSLFVSWELIDPQNFTLSIIILYHVKATLLKRNLRIKGIGGSSKSSILKKEFYIIPRIL